MVKFIQRAIRDFNRHRKPHKFPNGTDAWSGAWWIHRDGQLPSYFGGEEVCKKLKGAKLWASLGTGCSVYWNDEGVAYLYAVPQFRRLMQKIKNSGIENDVYLLCYHDAGGEVNKTRPSWSKEWNGKFL